MVRHIDRELLEIKQAIRRCSGDPIAEPKLTGSWMAHLLICSKELLHSLLIDTAQKPPADRATGVTVPRSRCLPLGVSL